MLKIGKAANERGEILISGFTAESSNGTVISEALACLVEGDGMLLSEVGGKLSLAVDADWVKSKGIDVVLQLPENAEEGSICLFEQNLYIRGTSQWHSLAMTSDVETISGLVTQHTGDTGLHVTAVEKAAWNNRDNFLGISAVLPEASESNLGKYVLLSENYNNYEKNNIYKCSLNISNEYVWEDVSPKGFAEITAGDEGKVLRVVDGTWQASNLPAGLDEAPNDGKTYARKNGTWVETGSNKIVNELYYGYFAPDNQTPSVFNMQPELYFGMLRMGHRTGEFFSLGDNPAGTMVFVALPEESGLIVLKNDGAGNGVPFDEDNGWEGSGANGFRLVDGYGTAYLVFGEFSLVSGEYYVKIVSAH